MSIKELSINDTLSLQSSAYLIDPAAAVRELIDNSVDSGALNIVVELDFKTGGCEYISVKDNGFGVAPHDRPLMCLNHYTSKIKAFSDLQCLNTLGFRGDALFIIANLTTQKGSLQITTKTKLENIAETWYVDSLGEIKANTKRNINSEVGTKVVIRNLLKGLHVRNLEYSKKSRNTIEKVKHLLENYSLNLKDVKFQFYVVQLDKDQSISSRKLQLNTETHISSCRNLMILANIPLTSKHQLLDETNVELNEHVKLDLIIPDSLYQTSISNSKRKCKFLTVNGRAMSLSLSFGKEITKSLNYSYENLGLPKPSVWFLNMTINPSIIDVNIEPEKNDIFCKNQRTLLNDLLDTISKLLMETKSRSLGNLTNHNNIDKDLGDRVLEKIHTNGKVAEPVTKLMVSKSNNKSNVSKEIIFNYRQVHVQSIEKQNKNLIPKKNCLSFPNLTKKYSLESSSPNILAKNNKQSYHSQIRRIDLFSEYTNKLFKNITVNTNFEESYNYENEINWLMREQSLNNTISTKIIELGQKFNQNIDAVFIETKHGWYQYTKKGNGN